MSLTTAQRELLSDASIIIPTLHIYKSDYSPNELDLFEIDDIEKIHWDFGDYRYIPTVANLLYICFQWEIRISRWSYDKYFLNYVNNYFDKRHHNYYYYIRKAALNFDETKKLLDSLVED